MAHVTSTFTSNFNCTFRNYLYTNHRDALLSLVCMENLFTRPGVAGAVLQSPPLLINSLIESVILLFKIFNPLSIQNRKSLRVEILKEGLFPIMCNMSRVTCQVSGVKRHIFCFFTKQCSYLREGMLLTGRTPSSF